MEAVTTSTTVTHERLLTPLNLSFERVAFESSAKTWQELDEVVRQLADKRALVEQHTTLAADHIRAVSMLNTEIDHLEKKFSLALTGMATERTRVQEKLRALVLEWERNYTQMFADKRREMETSHESTKQKMQDEIDALRADRDSKEHQLMEQQQKGTEVQMLLREYGLTTSGPLLESLRARQAMHSNDAVATFGSPNATTQASAGGSGAVATSRFTQQQQHQLQVVAEQSMGAAAERLRHEVTKLQADLAASRAESRMRLDEVHALRSARDDGPSLREQQHFGTSSQASTAAFYHLNSANGAVSHRSVATTSNVSANVMNSSRQLFEKQHSSTSALWQQGTEQAHNTKQVTSAAGHQNHYQHQQQQHVAVGIDLGTRRQQFGLRGVHVSDVVEHSPAFAAGIRKNDVILSWAGKATNRLEDVAAAAASVRPNAHLVIEYASQPQMNSTQLGPTLRASIAIEGKLDGPHNTRREHFRSP